MKTLFTVLVAIPTILFAQMPKDDVTGKFTYQEVIEIPGATKEDLFEKARMWYTVTYNDAKAVIEVEDKDAGRIVGKGIFTILHTMYDRNVKHVVTIEVKDGKYRYTFTNFYLDWVTTSMGNCSFEEMHPMNKKKVYGRAHEKMQSVLASLKKTMSSPLATSKDW